MEHSEIEALIKLIDDDDYDVYQHVRNRLLDIGAENLPILKEYAMRADNELQHQRLTEILKSLHVTEIKKDLSTWLQNNQNDLLEGVYLIAKYRFPELELAPIVAYIDKMKLDIWLRLNYKFSPLDNVRILNEIFFGKYRFHGDNKNYYHPENSYINQVIEKRKGNPVLLAVVYSVIAQRLYLPVFGVDLPKHFILAYKDDSNLHENEGFNIESIIPYNLPGEVIFYVNAFNGGAIFSKYNIERFLKQSNLSNEERYFEPCANIDIVIRIVKNLVFNYAKLNDDLRKQDMENILAFLLENK